MKLSSDIVIKQVLGRSIAVTTNSQLPFSGMIQLNESAAAIIELLRTDTTAEAVATAMAERFNIDPERARADVDAVVAQLRDRGLIVE